MRARFLTDSDHASTSSLASDIKALSPWFHNIHLRDGTETAPNHHLGDFPAAMWRQLASSLPEDLRGWTALDIGCNAGFYSLQLAQRGASVVALEPDPHFLKQARWLAAHFEMQDRIEFRQQRIYDLAGDTSLFDIVLFMGVFYHLRYPLLGLDIATARVRKLMVFQTLSLPEAPEIAIPDDQDFDNRELLHDPGWPKMAFVEKSLAGDPTNWWVPNTAGVEAMLRSSGMELIGRPAKETFLCQPRNGDASKSRSWDQEELRSAAGGSKAEG